MAKDTMYVCENCGAESAKWSGKCESCGSWNTLVEFKTDKKARNMGKTSDNKPVILNEIETNNDEKLSSGIGEFNRVLGGGIVSGAILLIAGDPGIGKSTLLLMVSDKIGDVLYISGEESVQQIKLRADRLGIKSDSLKLLSETDIYMTIKYIEQIKPKLVIIDSIQTMFDQNFPSTPGSLVQVRECALRLQRLAKQSGIPILLVGHATKDGNVAGPRTLEHLVDGVFYLEGDKYKEVRMLKSIKNRFGSTDEVGIFVMRQDGLREVDNPSELFIQDKTDVPGCVVSSTIEGNRPILVEVQALSSPTAFGYPRRTASGFDVNRLQLILAVLSNKLKLNLQSQDIYINVVGGLQLKDPGVDLAIACAIVSAVKNKKIDEDYCIIGELGLGGEIRRVSYEDKRYHEAKRLGYKKKIEGRNIITVVENIFS